MQHVFPEALDARGVRTRSALYGSLLDLMRTKSFDSITIREIAASAKVGYATYYRHYATREALLSDVVADQIRQLMKHALPLVMTGGMRESCRALCTYVAQDRPLWKALLIGGASGVLRETFIEQVLTLKGRYAGFSGWMPEDLHLACATGATIDILTWWISQKNDTSMEQVIDLLDQMIFTIAVRKN